MCRILVDTCLGEKTCPVPEKSYDVKHYSTISWRQKAEKRLKALRPGEFRWPSGFSLFEFCDAVTFAAQQRGTNSKHSKYAVEPNVNG